MASVGQTPAQDPQSIQVDASITRADSASEIALTGHSPSQAPQFTHASVILYAIINLQRVKIDLFDNFVFEQVDEFKIAQIERF